MAQLSDKAKAAICEYSRRWRIKNREYIREYNLRWRQQHKEHIREYAARYWEQKAVEAEEAAAQAAKKSRHAISAATQIQKRTNTKWADIASISPQRNTSLK